MRSVNNMVNGNSAAEPTYREYAVTVHALMRLRARFKELNLDVDKDDEELRDLIDDTTRINIAQGRAEKVDNGSASVVPLSGELDGMWAFIRPNNKRNLHSPQSMAIITLLFDWMVRENKQNGKWSRDFDETPNSNQWTKQPIRINSRMSAVPNATDTTRNQAQNVTELISEFHPELDSQPNVGPTVGDDLLVTWKPAGTESEGDSNCTQHLIMPTKDVGHYVNNLVSTGVNPSNIQIWKKSQSKIKFALEINDED